MTARRQIIAALSEDSMGGIATLHDVDRAEQLVNAHRAEVLHGAATALEASALGESLVYAAARLRRMADAAEVGEKSSRAAADATPEPDMPECVRCHNRRGPWQPTGDRYASGTQVLVCAGGCGEKSSSAGADATPELTVYRASHDSIVMGLYTTAAEARAHCVAEECRTWARGAAPVFDWIEDEEDGVAELVTVTEDGETETVTGYVVTALAVAAAYDEGADE